MCIHSMTHVYVQVVASADWRSDTSTSHVRLCMYIYIYTHIYIYVYICMYIWHMCTYR